MSYTFQDSCKLAAGELDPNTPHQEPAPDPRTAQELLQRLADQSGRELVTSDGALLARPHGHEEARR